MSSAAAPGKVVIWGEYAVLTGAPALVMAVNRYARVTVRERDRGWRLSSSGFVDEQTLDATDLHSARPTALSGAAAVVTAVLGALGDPPLPEGMAVHIDSTEFFRRDAKLGIGSSAAVCTALGCALAAQLDAPFDYPVALKAHRLLQGTGGSGLDVAAAYHGGLIRFQQQRVSQEDWPPELHYRFLWAGHPASTTDHVARFHAWRTGTQDGSLTALSTTSERLFSDPSIELLRDYVAQLKALDRAAGLGIYAESHRALDELAIRAQVVYKPCGAGGGDVGIAVGDDPDALDEFVALAERASFLVLDLEKAADGVHRFSE